jgi:hypothetical protein
MPFRARNPYYLRISKNNVLPLYVSSTNVNGVHAIHSYKLYLDDRHLDWMSDRVLQHVLEDLRPKQVETYLSTSR